MNNSSSQQASTPLSGQLRDKTLMLVDGYGFVFRAYHSMPPLTSPDGIPVGAILGFTNMLYKLLQTHKADYIAIILDAGEKTFRNDLYSEYKANRPPAPEDLKPQFPLIREVASVLSVPSIELEGYEADDLIATYARIAEGEGMKTRIISSDKDLMQLVNESIQLFDPMKEKLIGIEQVREKYNVPPEKVLDVLSLMGDSSDNIPGVPGIGPKTAAELIDTYGDLDRILEHAHEIKQKKRREMLIEHADQARLSRSLVRLSEDVPVPNSIESLKAKEITVEELNAFCSKYGFKALQKRLGKSDTSTQPQPAATKQKPKTKEVYTTVHSAEELVIWLDKQTDALQISVYVAHTKKDIPAAISIAISDSVAAYFPIAHGVKQQNLFDDTSQNTPHAVLIQALEALTPYLKNESIAIISNDIKALQRDVDCKITAIQDISVMSYILGAGKESHTVEDLISKEANPEYYLSEKAIETLDKNQAQHFACRRACFLLETYPRLQHELYQQQKITLYERIERPLITILADMERVGIVVSPATLKRLSNEFGKLMEVLEKEIHQLAGRSFNIGSPKQLGEVLFDEMGLKTGKKSKKTGAYSTGAEVLEELAAQGNDIAQHILQWRQLSKLKGTYTDALPPLIAEDGRIHTHYTMTATSTGRLSSYDPNLQNIPIRSEEGNKIREAFISKDGCQLISADYSQIELRLLADMADISVLKDAFSAGKDIHATTASQMFDVTTDAVSPEQRRKAKVINFGIIYGISAFGLAARLGIGRKEAADYIEHYFATYPGIQKYMERCKEFAREHGYIETLYGRRCYIPQINDKNPSRRQFSERAAINAPLQGSAADIIKLAMIQLHKKLEGTDSKVLLQVHDELIVEAPENEAEAVGEMLRHTMESAAKLSVPLTVEVGIGNNWREIH